MAASASGDGPNGFSFDATLMMLVGGQAEFARDFFNRPARLIHRQIFQIRIERQGVGILQGVDDFFHVHVFGDQVADERNFFGVVRPRFDGEIVDLGRDLITVRLGQQHGNGQGLQGFQDGFVGAQAAGQDDARPFYPRFAASWPRRPPAGCPRGRRA